MPSIPLVVLWVTVLDHSLMGLKVKADEYEMDSVVVTVGPDDPLAVEVVRVGGGWGWGFGGPELTRGLGEEAAASGNA
jgi:hypothetical protein